MSEIASIQRHLHAAMVELDAQGWDDLADDVKATFKAVAARFNEQQEKK